MYKKRYTFIILNKQGVGEVTDQKKVLLSVPSALLHELDDVAKKLGSSRNETVRIAIKEYISARRKNEIARRLEEGYEKMADMNSEWAEFCLEADSKCVLDYEAKLCDS